MIRRLFLLLATTALYAAEPIPVIQGARTGAMEDRNRLGGEERRRGQQEKETTDHGVVTARPETAPCKGLSSP